ncbi:MAG TPA: hypothetical protein PKA91_16620, partial [Leptospiraceae bacterium]|nr:hypothetical protein [Leptospiraceae bacterium]
MALLSHNLIAAGTHAMFQIVLAGQHTVQDADGEHPLKIFDGNESIMEVSGPFELRGGRLTELFLEFDPNTSVFFTSEGYVLDADIRVASVLSMTPEQENRIVQALGPKTNLVADSAELALEGQVETTTVAAERIPRTRVSIRIEDRLRGLPANMNALQLTVPGGVVNGLRLRVYGMPQFSQNERVILFLKRIGN